ncbi:hypothetical protein Pmani_025274 [Petrolisthes manimaculis]|uniref:Uncharacterized protein n=1 Tax=Petrolisthes manimaculis TaxID=1843537 RepID=A0AAE1U1B9_9EUCA|nr:hypothetical protein Pmani_025274 [Petrolisthes manimaculis]
MNPRNSMRHKYLEMTEEMLYKFAIEERKPVGTLPAHSLSPGHTYPYESYEEEWWWSGGRPGEGGEDRLLLVLDAIE